jgi:nitrile hydratase accessory protein
VHNPREGILDVEGSAAPPRRNGELVFDAPWESRAFGLAIALHEKGLFEWEEFRSHLIAEIGGGEREPDGRWSYYARWLAALEKTLTDKGLCTPDEIGSRQSALACRPHGHDHS